MQNTIDVGRNVGDCEIRSISFMDDSAYLKLFDPQDVSYFTIVFHKIIYFSFETGHAQNVIDSIVIFNSVNNKDAKAVTSRFVERVENKIPIHARLAHIRPITGGESFIIFEEFELQT
jgi:hypothetical protein